MHKTKTLSLILNLASIILIGVLLLSACIRFNNTSTADANTHPDVLASFFVTLSSPIPAEHGLAIELVDPLTIHNLNPAYLPMQSVDDLHFQVDLPAKKGGMLQYRYVLTGDANTIESGSNGLPISSRFFYITDHSRIQDNVIGFTNLPDEVHTGSVDGRVETSGSDIPAAGVIITIAGITTTSTIDGLFHLENIPVGTQNLTIFAPDGTLEPFEQQAVIEENQVTPIDIALKPRKLVNITFFVKAPENTPRLSTLRLFGNLSTLGDSFAGLFGGTDLVQNRAVVLTRQSDDKFFAVMQLPVDTEIQYLYSLGDTFWNRETNPEGNQSNRRFFIPDQDAIIEDQVASWETSTYKSILFKLIPPANTNPSDRIQIQFNAYGWMDPVDMWPVGDSTYEYELFNPLNFSKSVDYRYCRSQICGMRDSNTQSDQMLSFQSSSSTQVLPTMSADWSGLSLFTEPTTVTTEETEPRSGDFHTVIEISDSYRPAWLTYYEPGLISIKALNANTIILPVAWTFRSAKPVWLDLDLSQNPSISDIQSIVKLAKNEGYRVYLMAVTQYPEGAESFWVDFLEGQPAWDQWFLSVFNFYKAVSNLATSFQVDGVILGDEDLSSILGQTNEVSGTLETYPEDGTQRWDDIFFEIRRNYPGTIFLGTNFTDLHGLTSITPDNFDGVYVLNQGQISETNGDVRYYAGAFSDKLTEITSFANLNSDKKIWLGLDFPTISSSFMGCINISGRCMIPSVLNFPSPSQPEIPVSHVEQANLYNAILPEANRQDWLNGISTRRYLILGHYQDQSSSINGKPAADIIWYWFSTMTGRPTQ